MNNNLLEQWKTDLFRDQTLNKLIDSNISPEAFVFLILRDYNIVQLGDVFSKLSAVNHNIHSQMETYVKKYSEAILEDIRSNQTRQTPEVASMVEEKMKSIKQLQDRINNKFIWHYQQAQRLQPLYQNSNQSLAVCKELQKYCSQLKLLKQQVQVTGNAINIQDPVKVGHALQNIRKFPENLKQMTIYKKSEGFIKSVYEAMTQKVERKMFDALNTRSVPEINQSIQIYYSLGLLAVAIEKKSNDILKQQAVAYRDLFTRDQSTVFAQQNVIKDLRSIVKDDFMSCLQIFLINLALNQRDQNDMIAYIDKVQFEHGNLFQNYWIQYIRIIEDQFNNLEEFKERFENQYKNIYQSIPRIFDIYQECFQTFHEQLLLFPSALLHDFLIEDYLSKLKQIFMKPVQIYSNMFDESIRGRIKNVIQGVTNIELSNIKKYYEKSFTNVIQFNEKVKWEFTENLTENQELFPQMANRTLINLQRMYSTIVQKIAPDWPVQLRIIIVTLFPIITIEVKQYLLNHKLNYLVSFKEVEKLIQLSTNLTDSLVETANDPNVKAALTYMEQNYQKDLQSIMQQTINYIDSLSQPKE